MDLRKLKKLIDLVEGSSIVELEITEGEEKVRISKSGAGTQSHIAVPPFVASNAPASATIGTTKGPCSEIAYGWNVLSCVRPW